MEHINRIEIAGIIGNVKITRLQTKVLIRLTVATNMVFKRENDMVVETTWHNVTYYSKPDDSFDMNKLTRGQGIHAEGRLKRNQFTDAQGIQRSSFEIVANNLELVTE